MLEILYFLSILRYNSARLYKFRVLLINNKISKKERGNKNARE